MGTTTAGLEGVIAGESEICYIDGYQGVLSYRGYNIHTLAENATFEEVVFLLWNGWLPKQDELDALKRELVAARDLPEPVSEFLRAVPRANAMDVLRTAVSMLSLYDDEAQDMSLEANRRKAARLMAKTSTIVSTLERFRTGKEVLPGDPSLGFAANFLYALTGNKPDEVMERAFDVALTLHADHELNASTFAARVTAATLSDIYSCVTAGVGALKGPLHGGANQDVIRWLLDLGDEHEA
jgi:citrate synthase